MRVAFMRVAGLLVLLADLPFSLSASVTLRSSLPIVPDGGSLVRARACRPRATRPSEAWTRGRQLFAPNATVS